MNWFINQILFVILCLIHQIFLPLKFPSLYNTMGDMYSVTQIYEQYKYTILNDLSCRIIVKTMSIQRTVEQYSCLQISLLFLCHLHGAVEREDIKTHITLWVGSHCSLYPRPLHTIHSSLANFVLRRICELYSGVSQYKEQYYVTSDTF